VPRVVIERLREVAPNLAGLKVSDHPWDQFEPYLIEGLDVFVGPESLIPQGIQAGATGAVSALASAFPELVVAAVRGESVDVGGLRELIERFPRHAALKHVLVRRGVQIREDVRAPLRALTPGERNGFDAELAAWLPPA
jgi:dihydrodipicolinate synthase/N-acetylneuraminate lyase